MLWLIGLLLLITGKFSQAEQVKTIEVPVCDSEKNYTLPHFYYCDRYYSCIDGFVHEGQCADGFGYEPFVGCIYSHFVDCTSRPYFQPPKVNGVCSHLNGIFPDLERSCNFFYECIDGVPNMHTCVEGLVFDENLRKCRSPTAEEAVKCFAPKPELVPPMVEIVEEVPVDHSVFDAAGVKFKCPEDALYTFGDHARYPFPGKCRFYIICWKNGKTTVNGCPENTAFDPSTFTCEPIESVAQCRGQIV